MQSNYGTLESFTSATFSHGQKQEENEVSSERLTLFLKKQNTIRDYDTLSRK
jgi:hypothetical protein